MAKAKRLINAEINGNTKYKEGLLFVSFVFDGKRYVKTHQMAKSEMAMIKEHLKLHGEHAANTVISKQMIKNSGIVTENVLATAFLSFIKKNFKEEEVPKPELKEVIKAMAAQEGVTLKGDEL